MIAVTLVELVLAGVVVLTFILAMGLLRPGSNHEPDQPLPAVPGPPAPAPVLGHT